jgi:hypothetical protein
MCPKGNNPFFNYDETMASDTIASSLLTKLKIRTNQSSAFMRWSFGGAACREYMSESGIGAPSGPTGLGLPMSVHRCDRKWLAKG